MALAYFTVLMPLGVRTLAGVVLQIDKSLEECARVCGASWGYRMRTVTLPLLRPGIMAVWPHMSVAENVAYGLRVRKLTKVQIAEAVERALDLVQMRALADRSPGHYKAPEQSHSPSLVNLGAWAPSGCVTVRCAAPSSG